MTISCPGPACPMCTGDRCNICGDVKCEHDDPQRHTKPPTKSRTTTARIIEQLEVDLDNPGNAEQVALFFEAIARLVRTRGPRRLRVTVESQ